MIIRKATQKDIPKIIVFWTELMDYHKNLDSYHYATNRQAVNNYKKIMKKRIAGKNSTVLVAVNNRDIIGHICASIKNRSPCYEIRKNAFIDEVVVNKKYRRKGVCKKLTQELFKWFRSKNAAFVELHVNSKNKIGISMWKQVGFTEKKKIMYKKL